MADSYIGDIVGHLVFLREDDLASRIGSNHIISPSKEVGNVLKLIFAWEVEKSQISQRLHFKLIL